SSCRTARDRLPPHRACCQTDWVYPPSPGQAPVSWRATEQKRSSSSVVRRRRRNRDRRGRARLADQLAGTVADAVAVNREDIKRVAAGHIALFAPDHTG